MDGSQPKNPYLAGNFAPVADELDTDLVVAGELPRGLRGVFYRNGPNPQFEPRGAYHWFAGDGMVHAIRVGEGRVHYRNRYVRTPKWSLEHAAGRALFGGFDPMAADPSVANEDGGVANTNIVWHAGRLMALEEAHPPFALDPDTLDPLGYCNAYRGRVTAHPKVDPASGEMLWFAYSVGRRPFSNTVSFGVTAADGRVTRRDDFEAPFSSMVHDFLVTGRHVLFPILPLTGSLERVMAGGPAFAWEPEKGSHVGVMARDGGVETMRWFTTDAVYVFHPMNAWEDGERIVADVMEYPSAPLFPNADGSPGENAAARLVRWTFDLAGASDTIKREPLDDLSGEFPRFDERRAGLAYRHGWFAASESRPGVIRFDCLAHIDHTTGKRAVWRGDGGASPCEPVFVPRAPDAAEGDGWIVTLVYRPLEDASDFVVFDALDIAAGPIATARLPRRVPFGFHGNWRPLPA
ncbi:MAG TPA: carotenoid oxygenase family protein [Caulobacteraceae bacterium]|nr:carotenoid oxygenase family protein [Caulobacteraceae bacterium]